MGRFTALFKNMRVSSHNRTKLTTHRRNKMKMRTDISTARTVHITDTSVDSAYLSLSSELDNKSVQCQELHSSKPLHHLKC